MRTKCLGRAAWAALAMLAVLAAGAWGQAAAAAGDPTGGAAPTVTMDAAPAAEPAPTGTAPAAEHRELPNFNARFDDEAWAQMLQKGKALLGDVKDNDFQYDEAAFYWLVAQVCKFPADQMKPDAQDTAYHILLEHPSTMRGQPVTISGVYLKVTPFIVTVAALRKETPMLYECTIGESPLTNDSLLATVVTRDDPMKYLQKGDEVRVKGYFYKIHSYKRGDGSEGFSPMFIAQRLEPLEPGAGQGTVSGILSDPWMMPAAGILLLLVGTFIFLKMVTRSKPKHERVQTPNTVHKFHLRRSHLPPSPPAGGTGSPGGGPKP